MVPGSLRVTTSESGVGGLSVPEPDSCCSTACHPRSWAGKATGMRSLIWQHASGTTNIGSFWLMQSSYFP